VAEAFLRERAMDLESARAWGGVERLCAQFPELANLVELAASPEYVAARLKEPS